MNESPICFGLIDNQFSSSFIVPSNGTLASVKLVHVDGYVACNHTHLTFWGCGRNNKDVNVFIRNPDNGDIILPSGNFFAGNGGHVDYLRIPGYGPLSPELVLSGLSNPPNVTRGQRLYLSHLTTPSAGKSCCDVYARFT